jgi:hypothetical protein
MIPFRVLLGQVEEKKPDGSIIRHKQGKIVREHSFADNHILLMIADGHIEKVKDVDGETVSVITIPKTDINGQAELDEKGRPIIEKSEVQDGLTAVPERPASEAATGAAIAQAGEKFSEGAEARARAAWLAAHPGENPDGKLELDPAEGAPALGQGGIGAAGGAK